jgi:hypothetical protein
MQGHQNIENILKNYTREQAQNQIQNDNTNRNEQNNTGDRPTQPNNTQGHNAPSDREIEEFGEKIYKEEIGSYLVSVVNPAFIGDHRLWWGLKKGMTEKREAGGIVSWTFYDKYVIFRDGNRASIKEIREWKRNNGNIVNCLFFKNGLIKTYIYSNYPRLGYISLFLYEKEENNWVYIETLIVRK